jgi:transposase
VKVISRDRASAYADGANQGAPDAIQVADRYHLVANLRESLQRLLDRKRACLPPLEESHNTAGPSLTEEMPRLFQEGQQEGANSATEGRSSTTRAEALRQLRRSRRHERYQTVIDLHQQGVGVCAIARQTGISRNTVHRYLQAESFPEQGSRKKRRSLLDRHLPYLRERWEAGCQNAALLHRELQERGFHGSQSLLRARLSDWRAGLSLAARRTRGPKRQSSAPAPCRLSARQASFLFVKQPEALSETQRKNLEQMCQASDKLRLTYDLSGLVLFITRLKLLIRGV